MDIDTKQFWKRERHRFRIFFLHRCLSQSLLRTFSGSSSLGASCVLGVAVVGVAVVVAADVVAALQLVHQ